MRDPPPQACLTNRQSWHPMSSYHATLDSTCCPKPMVDLISAHA
jgi:hypothetical protein